MEVQRCKSGFYAIISVSFFFWIGKKKYYKRSELCTQKKKKAARGYKKRKRKQLYTRGERIYKQQPYTRVIIVKYNFANK